jgi:hypothetical protein
MGFRKVMENEVVLKTVDHAALKTNQALIILLVILAYILNNLWLVAVVGLMMLGGTLLGKPAFGFVYQRFLKPLGWVKPEVLQDHPEPHRFAQALGGVFLSAGTLFLLISQAVIGWALAWLVVALAAFNLFLGFCAGCAMYYWFNRLGLPGFGKTPPEGTFPGTRPKARI